MSNDLVQQPVSEKPCRLGLVFILRYSQSQAFTEYYHLDCLCLPFSLSPLFKFISFRSASGAGKLRGGTAIYGLYRYVPLQKVWFSSSLL